MSRFDYVRYDERAQELQDRAKRLCTELEKLVDELPPGRAQSLSLTKLEETYMWLGKSIRDDQIKRNGSAPLMEERKNG